MTFPAQLEVNRLLRRETSSSQALAQSFDQSQSSVNLSDIPSANENSGSTAEEDIYVIGDAPRRPKTGKFGTRDKNDTTARGRPWSSPFRPCRSSRVVPRVANGSGEETPAPSTLTAMFYGGSPRPAKSPDTGVPGDHANQGVLLESNAAVRRSGGREGEGGAAEVGLRGEGGGRTLVGGATSIELEAGGGATTDKRLEVRAPLAVPTISVDQEEDANAAAWRRQSNNALTSVDSSASQISSFERSGYVTERIHQLVTAFGRRASRVKAQITQPPTPSIELSDGEEDEEQKPPSPAKEVDSPEPPSSPASMSSLVGVTSKKARLRKTWTSFRTFCTFPDAIDPQGTVYIGWLMIVAMCFTYNAWVVPLRSIFTHYQTSSNLMMWFAFDYLSDFVYLFDVVVIKTRMKYIDSGFFVKDPKLMRRNYIKSRAFKLDAASLIPLDLFYLLFGCWSFFRLPRLLRVRCFWEFFNRLDSMLSSPHILRVARTLSYMLYLVHLNSCAYYGFSKIEGIGVNKWVFQGEGNAYIRCFYFATKTATSIGKNPKPENEAEYVFMTCSWLLGVFVFALLIGQIRDILATATRNQNEYQKVTDATHVYLQRLNVPISLQRRVRLWFSYTWRNQKTLDEMRALEWLPKKMRMDLALHVHMHTLSKVQLFQDCDKALLRDLVLKLRPVIFLPGDFVCKKGEVGKEMYIVVAGEVQVKDANDVTLASLGQGSVFGEISLLALAGGNRRTADVRSHGFSNLFVLSKDDLQASIKDYPEAQEILKKKAKRLIKQNEERERKAALSPDIIIKSRQSTPRILHTVLQVVRPDSLTADVIRRSSRYFTKSQCDLRSPGIPSWPSSSATSPRPPFPSSDYLDTESRRSSMENHNSRVKVRTSSLGVTSLSESVAEEEEEEEYLVVEMTQTESQSEGGALSPVPASPRSQHSISLQRGSSGRSDASERSRTTSVCPGERGSCISTPQSVRSLSSTPRSLGGTVRYSPMSLTRQAHVSSIEDPRSPEDQRKLGQKTSGKEEEEEQEANRMPSTFTSGSTHVPPKDSSESTKDSSTPLSQCENRNGKTIARRTSACSINNIRRNSSSDVEGRGPSRGGSHGLAKDRSERTRSSKKGRRPSCRSTSTQESPGEPRGSPKNEDNSVMPTQRGSDAISKGEDGAPTFRERVSASTNRTSGSAKSQRKVDLQVRDKTSASRRPQSGRLSSGKAPKKHLQGQFNLGSSVHDKNVEVSESALKVNDRDSTMIPAQEGKVSGNKYPHQGSRTQQNLRDMFKMTSSGETSPLLSAFSPGDTGFPQQEKSPKRQDGGATSTTMSALGSSTSSSSSTVSCTAMVHQEDAPPLERPLPRPLLPRPSETLRQSLLQERTPVFESKQGNEESKF